MIRKATMDDCVRIAEIEIFNYRINFYPIFREDEFYFDEIQVPKRMEAFKEMIETIWVYDDGVVKGFIQVDGQEIKKLFVEPVLQGNGIGAELLRFAVDACGANQLWALEKNVRAIRFYERHGFCVTGEKKPEEDTTEYLIRIVRKV